MSPLQILLVDDDPDYRLIMRRFLRDQAELYEAGTLREGIARYLGGKFDCVLLDLSLPDSQLNRTFQTFMEQTGKAAVVVIISGYSQPEFIADIINRGAQGYLIKGEDDNTPRQLRIAIQRAIKTGQIIQCLDTTLTLLAAARQTVRELA